MEYWLLRRLPPPGAIATYNGLLRYGGVRTDSGWTYGGYTGRHTVPERFVIKVPDGFPLESAGPVFCAGITMFSPLTNYGADKVTFNQI